MDGVGSAGALGVHVGTISIALPYSDRWYFAEILRGARERIEAAGHIPIVHVIPPSPTSTLKAVESVERDFATEQSIGGIAVGFKYAPEHRERTLAWHRPLVMIGGSVTGFATVLIDDSGGAWTATDHLMQLGHTRIAHLAGNLQGQMDFSVHSRRAKGYRMAMERAGLPLRIVECDFDAEDVRQKTTALLAGPDRPTAVFAMSDEIAFAAMTAAADLGITVGRELSLIGFDDHPGAEERDLSTIRQRPNELGSTAVEMLLLGLDTDAATQPSRLSPTSLITRGSTRRLA